MSAMTQPTRAPISLQPRSKSIATTSNSSLSSIVTTPPISSAPSRKAPSISPIPITSDAFDRATASLIRRTLCVHHPHVSADKGRMSVRPIDELLPPLTSSNDVDLQLYGFIACIMRDFVYSWYGKITPDHFFVDEVIQLIAHCTRALEQRFRELDLESLLLDEIPELVEAHIIGTVFI